MAESDSNIDACRFRGLFLHQLIRTEDNSGDAWIIQREGSHYFEARNGLPVWLLSEEY